MKKLYLILFAMLFTGYINAQSTHTIDFEPAGIGADWSWTVGQNADDPPLEFVANPDNSGINTSATVAKFTARAAGNPWALTFTDDDGEFTFDADNSTVKIMVYKDVISNVAMKFEGLSPAVEIQIPNTVTGQWEELTFDFSASIGNTYSRIVIIPDFAPRTEDHIIFFDNIQTPDGIVTTLPEPTTIPPVPAHAEEDVISIYTEVYPNLPGTDFNPNWGQSTAVTVDYVAAGNNTLKYENLNYQGTQYANQDVSGFDYLHVDFWTPNSTGLNFYLISPGNETAYALPITPETWVSVDVPLSHFVPPVDLTDVFQFKVDGNGTVYFDNWYFWKEPAGSGTDATLSDLMVDDVTIDGFSPNVFSYDVALPDGTTEVPVVAATTNDPNASYVVNDATALPGTTEVVVTAEDGTTQQTYSINFTIAGPVPVSDYCETEVFHLGNPAEEASAILLTITNMDASSMLVEIESATADPVDLLIVAGGSGAAISPENTSVPGKISRTLSWTETPPEEVSLNVLWSKETFPGNWQLSPEDFLVPFAATCEPSGPAVITFKVDMSEYEGTFTNVYVSGTFNGWSGEANQLLDPDMDNVYEAEIELENGSYEYKFTLDNWTVQEEFNGGEPCTVTNNGFTNRFLAVAGSEELPPVCWNSCFECGAGPQPVDITFKVDMSHYEGEFTNVYVSGSLNGWCGDCNQMLDPDMDMVYETTIALMPGTYEFKYTLDNWTVQEEFEGGEPCTITTGIFTNRIIEVTEEVVLPLVCWNSCDPCPNYPAGWNGISANVMPEEKMALEDLFAPIIDDLIILINREGFFWPAQNLNTLGDWDTYRGYKVKFANDVYFEFTGAPLTDRTVTLDPGVYYIPVLSEGPVNVEDLIVPLGNDIEYMYNITTMELYWPAGGILPGMTGALNVLCPGTGYLTKINETVTIDFGSVGKSAIISGISTSTKVPANWNEIINTGTQHLISVNTSDLSEGDIVGAFNADGTCTGITSFNGLDEHIPLVVFGNDMTTNENEGMAEQEMISFRLFRNGQEQNIKAVYDQTMPDHNGLFKENGLSVISGFKAGATGITDKQNHTFSVYPNPSGGEFTIETGGKRTSALEVLNAQGQVVFNAKMNGIITIDLKNQPKGMYYIRLISANETSVKKVIIK